MYLFIYSHKTKEELEIESDNKSEILNKLNSFNFSGEFDLIISKDKSLISIDSDS